MIRKLLALPLVFVLLTWLTSAPLARAVAPPPPAEAISQLIRALDDDSFAVREDATLRLHLAGPRAIAPLAEAASGDSLEATNRIMRVLRKMLLDGGSRVPLARQALIRLTAAKQATTASQARSTLRLELQLIVDQLEKGGARVNWEVDATTGLDRPVAVNLDDAPVLLPLLPLLKLLPDLESISASNRAMDDEAMALLRGLPRLRELNLFSSRVGDDGLKHLRTLPSLRRVPMGQTRVTDKGLVHLAGLKHIEYVGLRGNAVTDKGLVHLAGLASLTGLYLGETKVSDAGLVHLKELKKLNYLRLDKTGVSDDGIEHLLGLRDLEYLYLAGSRVSTRGIDRLRKALPRVSLDVTAP